MRRERRCVTTVSGSGRTPYENITIVDPAWQSDAGGMEYPMLFTAGTRWLAPRRVAEPEGVTVHEAGHQFWYGVVATNEFEHAWMDEGLNTFSDGARRSNSRLERNTSLQRYFGGFVPWVFDDLLLNRSTVGNRLNGYRNAPDSDTPSTPSWRYWPATGGVITYNKTALWLNTLERMLGWDTLQKILSTYYARYAFKHPEPKDFFAVVNEVSGRDMTWFFDQVYRSSSIFDYGVDALHQRARVGSRLLRRRREAAFSADERVRRRSIAPGSSSGAAATGCSRSRSASCSRTTRRCAGSGMGATAGRCSRSIGRSARRARRSIPTASCSST